jgi:anthranilate phosphoribosyltransferase
MSTMSPDLAMRACIQKVATGPEYSKDLSFEEARSAMQHILDGEADPVQAGVFFIALRMKRETDDENRGVLQAIIDRVEREIADVDEVVDIADPYDGYTRGLPVSPFLAPAIAACGLPAFSHGLETVGPKYGATHRKVLRAAGVDVDLDTSAVAARLQDPEIGWGYVDQGRFCPTLHALVPLRQRIVKRPVVTTVEVLAGPIRGRSKTHFMTGYVHKPYPPIYANLARLAGFDSAVIVRGVEGGVIPSLKQPARVYFYREGIEEHYEDIDPGMLEIVQATRAVPVPDDVPQTPVAGDEIATKVDIDALSEAAAAAGQAALAGEAGPARDSLVYSGAILLSSLGRYAGMAEAGEAVRQALDSGEALARFKAGLASTN